MASGAKPKRRGRIVLIDDHPDWGDSIPCIRRSAAGRAGDAGESVDRGAEGNGRREVGQRHFRLAIDTMLKLIGSPNLEYKKLTAA